MIDMNDNNFKQFDFQHGVVIRLSGSNYLDGFEFQYSTDNGKTFSEWLTYFGDYKQPKRIAQDIYNNGLK